jgi:hypothetical protein
MITERTKNDPDSLKVLNKALRKADDKAARISEAKGFSVVKKYRNKIVEVSPSGRKTVLETIRPSQKLDKKVFKM